MSTCCQCGMQCKSPTSKFIGAAERCDTSSLLSESFLNLADIELNADCLSWLCLKFCAFVFNDEMSLLCAVMAAAAPQRNNTGVWHVYMHTNSVVFYI